MTTQKCPCGEHDAQKECAACRKEDRFPYWCTTCRRAVPEKRCPYCGLKAQKKKL